MGIKWAAKGAGKAGAKLSAAALRSWLGMQRNRMKVAAVTVCLAALFGWFTAIVPMTCAAFQSFPMVSSSRTGFAQWLAWLQSYFFDSVLTLRAVRSTDWLSTGAFIGYGLLAFVVGIIAFGVLRPRPPANDIIDAQPAALESNEHGNTKWMRTEREIVKELKLEDVKIEDLPKAKGGLYVGEFGPRVLLAADDEHALILAPTRIGKTRRVLLKMIACLGMTGECMCIFDPKGELFGFTSEFLERNGYAINRIDFRSPSLGSFWNPLSRAIEAYDGTEAQMHTSKLMQKIDKLKDAQHRDYDVKRQSELDAFEDELNLRLEEAEREIKLVTSFVFPREIEKEGNSKFFNDGAENLIQMVLHFLCSSQSCPKESKTLYTASMLLSELCKPEKLTKAPGEDRIFSPLIEEVHKLQSKHPAYRFMLKVDNTRNLSDFITTATGSLAPYTSTAIARMMSTTDRPLHSLADEKTATFIIVPNDEETFKDAARLYINQLYSSLVRRADVNGQRLPIRMNIMCEEFKQLPRFTAIDERLSICAGYGIRWIFVLQSLTQLESAYERENAATIMENCSIQLCLRAGTPQTGDYIEKKCGTYTMGLQSSSTSKVPQGIFADRTTSSESRAERARCRSDEAQRWDPEQGAILFKSGCQPACSPVPELSLSPFNEMLGLGDVEHNRMKSKEAREKAIHMERIPLFAWSIEMNNAKKLDPSLTDEQRKKNKSEYLRKLYYLSKTRQGNSKEDQDKEKKDSAPQKPPKPQCEEPSPLV